MNKSTHGSEPIRTEQTGTKYITTLSLATTLRNWLDETERIHLYAVATDSVRAIIDIHKERFVTPDRTAIAIEVLREKLEELETTSIGVYEGITGRKLDITYLRKSIELLTKK